MSPSRRSSSTPAASARARAPASIAGEASIPITVRPGRLRDRHRDAPVADGELDDRPVGLARELHVPRDVLRHVRRPLVVDRRERVVGGRHEADAIVGRPMDLAALEREATAAVAAATSVEEVEEARVRYLGPQGRAAAGAPRGARPRDRHGAERAARSDSRPASPSAARRSSAPSSTAGSREEPIDVTLPGERVAARPPAPDHPDPARGRGHLPRARLRGRRRARGRDDALQLRRAQLPGRPSVALAPRDALPRRRDGAADARRRRRRSATMEAQEPPVYIVSLGRIYRRDTPDATHTPIFHQVEGLAVDHGITLADLEGTLDYLAARALRRGAADRVPDALLPLHRAVDRGRTSPAHVCDGAGCPVCRHSGWIEIGGAGMVDPNALRVRRLRPRARARASRSAGGSSGSPSCGTASPTCASSGGTTCDCWGSSRCASRSPGSASTSTFDVPVDELARRLVDLDARGRSRARASACPTRTATSASSASAGSSRPASTRTPTGSSSAASTSGRASRARSCAAPGTSAPARRSPSRCPARCCPGSTSRSARRSSAASSRAG